jgi:tetratricopeptide (TPR) repeat protein
MAGLPNLISCPKLGDWLHLAIGAAGPTEVDVLLTHAAICSACAVRLRQSLRLLAEEASSEETAEVSNLPSASREWQHQLAVELAHSPLRPRRGRAWGWYLWAGSALAASLVLAGGLTLWWQHMNTPERLLAEAYTHDRIFNLRMPGSGFAEVTPETHLRGGASGHESSRLLDARARIERHLENAPEDPHWLQLEGRADVLEEKFDPAIDIFDRLLVAGPVTSSLLTDDASAYFQRGTVTGSENDRATALDYLRRADELAPGDTLVLFNEAVVMEDRGQVMNTVETWNRYLRFERDPRWLAEGRRRLQALEQKLNQLKTHQSRMEQHLATPQAMLSLAADPATLNALDEELSSSLLPKLLGSAFPLPLDRSRGSPCERSCQAARTLLHALADSLQHNHQDPWLNRFLPTASTSPNLKFTQAAQALGKAIDADVTGDYLPARKWALQATRIFRGLGNAAGEDRAEVERSYALLRSSDIPGCYGAIHPLLERDPQFAWIHIHVLTQDALCDSSPGSAAENNPSFLRAISLAYDRRYTLLELRARILLGAAAVDSGDAEASWRIYLPTVRRFYTGDYPPIRLYNTLSGLEEVEESTPRLQSTLLLQKEVVGVLELTPARQLIPTERFKLASVAIRAGAVPEAQHQMRLAEAELAANGGGESVKGFLAENEMAMADLYLARHDLSAAAKILDAARGHIAGERNTYHRRDYAVDYGQLELALGHPEAAESMVRDAVLEDERLAAKGGAENITLAQQDRDLYAILAGLWVAQGRPGEDILALWERYRLRILGKPVPICAGRGLACLQPQLSSALKKLGPDRVLGQIVLSDRVLLYRANAQGVVFGSISVGKDDLLAAIRPLERAASSPATSQDSVDYAARRVGEMLLGGGNEPPVAAGQLLLEPDPILGNLP